MVRVIAHRGASAAAPENTVEAFELARELGADWVELDVRRSADTTLAIHHDPVLADGRAIVGMTGGELPESVPDLAAALDACAGMKVNIEIKNWPEDPDFDPSLALALGVVEEIQRRGAQDDVLVSCFHLSTLDRVREADPTIATALLHGPRYGTWADLASLVAERGHCALHPWDHIVDRWYMRAARDAGLEVNVWTVDNEDRMRELVALGVDGICTNVPDVARSVLDGAA
ncbi:MAG: glycerophosphodiester phosphodiesterase [Acidimicrobiales bacterium]|nr:glycerophosphodiester phosphodiesterase [Acidimicrobiales bacterium]